jgi:predicted O-methyltransferase YrrM
MNNLSFDLPEIYNAINETTKQSGFTMASDVLTGSLLRTLAATKPTGKFLELGTGTGLSTSWILDGMDKESTLISIDNDDAFLQIAKRFLGKDDRVTFVLGDGETWVEHNRKEKFDYIFADTWHGKYLLLDEVLAMLNKGGIYIIDDMLPQPNWPDGHEAKATALLSILQHRNDLFITPQIWSTGIVIVVKK